MDLRRIKNALFHAMAAGAISGLLIAAAPALARAKGTPPQFTYAGGTENLEGGCGGKLELTGASMTFQCPEGAVTIPYDSITLMQYRPAVSPKVRHMKLPWKVKPSGSGGKKNLFFTVLYKEGERTHALVLRVIPDEMRPYLAEIELNTGKRIQVWDYRGFE
ncbi:MAG TPA: hypothetical protein VFZ08_01130 [Terriglobia bacterium]|nr:hypothetical protein [Terriglobia bacterium]